MDEDQVPVLFLAASGPPFCTSRDKGKFLQGPHGSKSQLAI